MSNKKYFIEDYFSGLPILDDSTHYIRYFNSLKEAENFLCSLGNLNDDDNFYIVECLDGQKKSVEY